MTSRWTCPSCKTKFRHRKEMLSHYYQHHAAVLLYVPDGYKNFKIEVEKLGGLNEYHHASLLGVDPCQKKE